MTGITPSSPLDHTCDIGCAGRRHGRSARVAWGGLALGVLGVLGACVSAPQTPAPGPVAIPGLRLQPAQDGLEVIGSGGRQIGFGRARIGALDSIARVEGRIPVEVACTDPNAVAYGTASGLVIIFAQDRFVGWRQDAARAGRGCE